MIRTGSIIFSSFLQIMLPVRIMVCRCALYQSAWAFGRRRAAAGRPLASTHQRVSFPFRRKIGGATVQVVLGFETSSAAHVPGGWGTWQAGRAAGGGRDALATSRQGMIGLGSGGKEQTTCGFACVPGCLDSRLALLPVIVYCCCLVAPSGELSFSSASESDS